MAARIVNLNDSEFALLASYLGMNRKSDSLNLEHKIIFMRENKIMSSFANRKYEWATPDAKSDKQFLQWLWSRLHQVFGERENDPYMQRLDSIIDKMPGNQRLDVTDDGKWDIYRKGKLVHSDPE